MWYHYLIWMSPFILYIPTMWFLIKIKTIDPFIKGILIGLLMFPLVFTLVGSFHIEEMAWKF